MMALSMSRNITTSQDDRMPKTEHKSDLTASQKHSHACTYMSATNHHERQECYAVIQTTYNSIIAGQSDGEVNFVAFHRP